MTCFPASCGPRLVRPAETGPPSNPTSVVDWSDWGVVLNRTVTGGGVDYSRLGADGAMRMDRLLTMLAQVGPVRTPHLFGRLQDRLAYFVNAYNIAVFQSVCELLRRSRPSPWDLATMDRAYAFVIDGRQRTPADLRREALTLAADDWRVRLALCDGRSVGPPLWPRPILADLLDAQLNQIVRGAVESDSVVAVHHGEEKQLALWSGLYEMRGRLVADYEDRTGARGATILNVLLAWADEDRRAALNAAVGYDVVAMADASELNIAKPPPDNGLLSSLGLAGPATP